MENFERQARQAELRDAIGKLVARQRTIVEQEIKELVAARVNHTSTLDSLNSSHTDACCAEAIGQPNEREEIARDIATTSAKIHGVDSIIANKQTEIKQIHEQLEPLENELRKLDLEESRAVWLAEIQQSFNEGKEEIRQILALTKSHTDRVTHLRSKYNGVVNDVRAAAFSAAEKLANAHSGFRVSEAFTPEEIRELRAAKLVV